MKKCPYCAEEIQDEAIKCRYCHSDLTVAPGQAAPAAATQTPAQAVAAPVAAPEAASPAASASQVKYTHSGYRYVLGYGADFFGIWDRQYSSAPAQSFPRTDAGWKDAWTRFVGLEPQHQAVPPSGAAPAASPAADAPGWGAPAAATTPVQGAGDNDALQYTHSGQRYLLGYGKTFFGIWDRTAPHAPTERFARDDAGWQAAWRRFTAIETHYTEVALGGSSGGSPGSTPTSL